MWGRSRFSVRLLSREASAVLRTHHYQNQNRFPQATQNPTHYSSNPVRTQTYMTAPKPKQIHDDADACRDAARRCSIDGAPIEIYRQHTRGQIDGIARTHWS